MARGALTSVLRYLRNRVGPVDAGPEDAQLLRRFIESGEETAFEALLRRHGPLVWGVCRRVLACEQDAEDAFQATFLVLLRRASSIRKRASLGSFLHGVAHRIAARARANARRHVGAELRDAAAPADVPAEASGREVQAILDEEVARLPERLRTPVVLCCLEGKDRAEAAAQLGWREGTVASRLARARERLRARLAGRGVRPAGALAVLSGGALALAVPEGVAASALRLAGCFAASEAVLAGTVSTPVAALAKGALRAMAFTRVKVGVALAAAVCVLAAGAGWAARQALGGKPAPVAMLAAPGTPDAARKERTDYYGDPLPPGVLARMGSVRFRHEGARVAFTGDGKTLVSAGKDASVAFWDTTTGRAVRRTPTRLPKVPRTRPGASVEALSPDGKVVVLFGPESVYLHDTATGEELRRLPAGGLGHTHAAFSPDGKLLATVIGLGGRWAVRLWDVSTGKERFALRERSYIGAFLPSPDGKLLACREGAVGGEVIRLWDTATGRELGHVRGGGNLAFSPDGKTLASVDRDGTVTLWETATLKKQATLKPSAANWTTSALTYSPDGTLLAVAGDKGVVLWDVKARKERRRLAERDAHHLAFAPGGKVLACAGEFEIRLWDVRTGERLHRRPGHDTHVWSVAVSPDGKVMASAAWRDPVVRLWDAGTGKPLPAGPTHRDSVRACAFSPEGEWLVSGSGSADSNLRLWKAATGEEVRRFVIQDVSDGRQRHEVLVVHLSDDGKRVAAVSWAVGREGNGDRRQVSVWDARTGKLLARRPFRGGLGSRFTPDGEGVTVDGSESLVIEGTRTGETLATIPGDLGRPVAFTPDGALVAVGIRKTLAHPEGGWEPKGVRVAEVATGGEVFRVDGWVDFVAFSPDGRVLATADPDALRLWDVATGKRLFRRAWPGGLVRRPLLTPVYSLAFVPGARALATGMGDGTVLVWDLTPVAWPADGPARRLGGKELEGLWADLAADARKAHRGVHALASAPAQAVPLLGERLRPAAEPDPKVVAKWVGELDSERFELREEAARELARLGEQVGPALRRVLEKKPSLEMRRRVEALLRKLRGTPPPPVLRALRAIRVLERVGTLEARRVLRKLAGGAAAARETREAKAALERLARRPSGGP